jgi:excisionase family DNA binding protein
MPDVTWLDVDGAARHSLLSAPTILRAARRGELRAFKVGAGRKLWRFRVEDVNAWLMGTSTPQPFTPQKDEERGQAARPVALINTSRVGARPDANDNTRRAS